jgi:hypothetical protein
MKEPLVRGVVSKSIISHNDDTFGELDRPNLTGFSLAKTRRFELLFVAPSKSTILVSCETFNIYRILENMPRKSGIIDAFWRFLSPLRPKKLEQHLTCA